MMFGEVLEGCLVGLVLVFGLGNLYVVIFVCVMGIFMVMGVVDLLYFKVDGIDLIVDGYYGEVYINFFVELVC